MPQRIETSITFRHGSSALTFYEMRPYILIIDPLLYYSCREGIIIDFYELGSMQTMRAFFQLAQIISNRIVPENHFLNVIRSASWTWPGKWQNFIEDIYRIRYADTLVDFIHTTPGVGSGMRTLMELPPSRFWEYAWHILTARFNEDLAKEGLLDLCVEIARRKGFAEEEIIEQSFKLWRTLQASLELTA